MNRLEAISTAVAALDEKTVLYLVEAAIAEGNNSVDIVHAVQEGMRVVGERYEQKDIYLSGLIMAGEIFRSVMAVARPGLESELAGDASGRVLLGTVAGDIHDIGKNMAALAFRMFGFTVEDLGVDVPPESFLEAARSFRPEIVGLSGLLSTAFTNMRDTVALLRQELAGSDPMPVFVIGGGTIDEQVARYVGADLWTDDAMEGVRLCQRALENRR
ncbi:MAG: cobalamin-dependent protein [Actinomycetia bacterium]|nr:cobalamin-dependent protein [Actinomycetes bacterium]